MEAAKAAATAALSVFMQGVASRYLPPGFPQDRY